MITKENEVQHSITWSEYYKDRVCNRDYDKAFIQKYNRFIMEIILKIKSFAEPGITSIVLKEEGCGIGTVSKCISKVEPLFLKLIGMSEPESYDEIGKVVFTDINSDMLDLCRLNTRMLSMGSYLANKPSFYARENILLPKYYEPNTVVVTHGVLEHFQDTDIQQIVQTYDNENVLFQAHYVPTSKYEAPSYGDERLMSVESWIQLVQPDYYIVDNEGLDLYMFKLKKK